MTILTKPISGEKKDKLAPLVQNDQLATAPPSEDLEGQPSDVVFLKARARRVSTATTLCLILTSLIVVSIGIFVGKSLYNQYISAQMRRFTGYAQIPMPSEDVETLYFRERNPMPDSALLKALSGGDDDDDDNNVKDDFDNIMRNYFREDFEIDLDGEKYEKIDVPDFRDGRSGRFIHDFNTNTTGIIDITGNRCFVMPLNRGHVLPPRSLFDLVNKMWDGYYKVDTQVVRETMRVVTPPLKDLKGVGSYIAKECENRPVYKLEKYVGGVVKRSADLHVQAKFAQFSGNKITEFDILNFEDVQDYEKKNNIH
ncbi:integral membrane protein 2A [Tribolium madens]|uniref:integral membrane protein 2A n=1 Tax=Tribolium madens TaxID=41895 RepID=UPI001CF72F78|nr:integral membrane protein 2A [Tribolium madens]